MWWRRTRMTSLSICPCMMKGEANFPSKWEWRVLPTLSNITTVSWTASTIWIALTSKMTNSLQWWIHSWDTHSPVKTWHQHESRRLRTYFGQACPTRISPKYTTSTLIIHPSISSKNISRSLRCSSSLRMKKGRRSCWERPQSTTLFSPNRDMRA